MTVQLRKYLVEFDYEPPARDHSVACNMIIVAENAVAAIEQAKTENTQCGGHFYALNVREAA